MSFDKYNLAERKNTFSAVAFAFAFFKAVPRRPLTDDQWLRLIVNGLFPRLQGFRDTSSELARTFYDAERTERIGDVVPIDLAGTSRRVLVEQFEPVRPAFQAPVEDANSAETLNARKGAADRAAGLTERAVQQGGRATLLQAVGSDDRCKGWARVAGGAESCSFCTLLISRGPVYSEDTGQFLAHAACDCRAVPVFDKNDWPGRVEWKEAERLYREATKGETGDKAAAFRRYIDDKNRQEKRAA